MATAPATNPVRSLLRWVAGGLVPAAATNAPEGTTPLAQVVLHGPGPYLFSAASVALATYGSLYIERFGLRSVHFPLMLFSVASTIWYPGVGPAVLAVILASLSMAYYFVEPVYSFAISASSIPYFVSFVLFSVMLTGFSVIRRNIERALCDSRERLLTEVAERKAREEQIQRLNQQLERRTAELEITNGELEAFSYSVSHDLRSPLRHMAGFAELLQTNAAAALDDKSRRHMKIILDSARRMGELIDDLLAFSRVGRVESHESTVSLRDLVNEVVEERRPEIASREVMLRVGNLPDIHGDRSLLRLVLSNLVGNALKFTRTRERPEIEIGSFEDGRGVVVFVKDNGVGFDMKYSNKLFRVFQRLHRSEDFEGTGIGLATVQRVIHRHEGSVWADGVVNGGATFYFSVPAALKR